jgi:hypothetical protein
MFLHKRFISELFIFENSNISENNTINVSDWPRYYGSIIAKMQISDK